MSWANLEKLRRILKIHVVIVRCERCIIHVVSLKRFNGSSELRQKAYIYNLLTVRLTKDDLAQPQG